MNIVSTLSNLQDTSNSTYQLLQSYPNFTEPDEQILQITRDSAQKLANVVSTLSNLQDTSNSTYQLLQSYPNFTEPDEQISQITRDSAQKLVNIVNTLSNLQDTSTSTAGVVDDVLLLVQELLVLHNGSTALPTSCKEIKERHPLSPSGAYALASNNAVLLLTAIWIRCVVQEEDGQDWHIWICPMLHRTVLLGLYCTSQEELELVVDQQQTVVVVYQFNSHLMVSVILRCVVELLDTSMDQLMQSVKQ